MEWLRVAIGLLGLISLNDIINKGLINLLEAIIEERRLWSLVTKTEPWNMCLYIKASYMSTPWQLRN